MSAPDFRKMAEGYDAIQNRNALMGYDDREPTRQEIFLAGVNAALEAAAQCADRVGSSPKQKGDIGAGVKVAAFTITDAIRSLKVAARKE